MEKSKLTWGASLPCQGTLPESWAVGDASPLSPRGTMSPCMGCACPDGMQGSAPQPYHLVPPLWTPGQHSSWLPEGGSRNRQIAKLNRLFTSRGFDAQECGLSQEMDLCDWWGVEPDADFELQPARGAAGGFSLLLPPMPAPQH